MFRLKCLLVLALWGSQAAQAADVYRYQDEQGRWHFSDKKPKAQHETLNFKAKAEIEKPSLNYKKQGGERKIFAANPWWGPVQLAVLADGQPVVELLFPPRREAALLKDGEPLKWQPNFKYHYWLGDPKATFDNQPLLPPIPPIGKFQISQGFNGSFSHTNVGNAYAVDIAMQVGDGIHAARAGTVVWVKDDYHMGGRDNFFLDKANHVRILHSDGTLAVYAHILLGSASVKVGDVVVAGQHIARCGSSGYSTGPHLHFAVQIGGSAEWRSVPFQFWDGKGRYTPMARQWIQAPSQP